MSLTTRQAYQSPSFRKIGLLVVTAVMFAAVSAGSALEGKSHGSPVARRGTQIDPLQITVDQKDLPTQQTIDLSMVFD
jgi:hypothetical protein